MKDSFGREIDYMRISITDRCNLRCRYCMPAEGVEKISMSELLTYEEIVRAVRQAVVLGITRFKITGGEPLVRRGCAELIGDIKSIDGVEQVTLTTNGQILKEHIEGLKRAGVDGINVSLDSLHDDRYTWITRGGRIGPVLEGINESISQGVRTKVNCLIQKKINEDEVLSFGKMAFEKGIDVRFIETMPVGFADACAGVSNSEILKILKREWPQLDEDRRSHGNGPAKYYYIPGRAGSNGKEGAVGLISAIHGKFCGECNRIRLSSTGRIKPCLCFDDTVDILPALRRGDDESVRRILETSIRSKPAQHTFISGEGHERRSMVQIGG